MPPTILLRCHDIEETREFYQSALGFDVRETSAGTLTVGFHGGVLIFTSDDLWGVPPSFSGTIYFSVPDADGYFAAIEGKVAIAWPIQNMPYGSREFGVKDCNGYYLAFKQQS